MALTGGLALIADRSGQIMAGIPFVYVMNLSGDSGSGLFWAGRGWLGSISLVVIPKLLA